MVCCGDHYITHSPRFDAERLQDHRTASNESIEKGLYERPLRPL
jgi:hypothetical protein